MTSDQTGDQTPQDVYNKITAYFEKDPNKWTQITEFLTVDDNQIAKRYLQVLTSFCNNDVVFNKILDTWDKDMPIPINDPSYLKFMTDIWENCLKPNENRNVGVNGQRFDFRLILSNSLTNTTAVFNLISTLSKLDSTVPNKVNAEATVGTSLALTLDNNFKNLLQVTESTSANLFSNSLVAGFLYTETVTHLQLWWRGGISGRRCSKNIIDSFAGMAAGVGGGIVGATAGSSIVNGLMASTSMAIGSIIGAVIFGVISATAANKISEWLTQKLFNLPKDVALEKAYKFLGLEYGASKNEINASFVQLALKYHSYKGGTKEDWQKLQYSINQIKLSKGEF